MQRQRLRVVRPVLIAAAFMVAASDSTFVKESLADELDDRRQRLEAMTAGEKEVLLRKKERFDRLSEAEQQRMRKLHAAIARHEDGERLRALLERYNEWLKTLPSSQRAKLLGLPVEERIKRIKLLQQQQVRRTLGLWEGKQKPPGDAKRLFAWANDYVKNHQSEILAGLPPQERARFHRADPRRQQRMLLFRAIGIRGRRRAGQRMPMPSLQELEQLKGALSPPAREILENEPDAVRRAALVQRWLQVSVLSKLLPPVDDEDLRRLEKSLSDTEREKLDQLSPNQRWMRLRRLYYTRNRPVRDPWGRRVREHERNRRASD